MRLLTPDWWHLENLQGGNTPLIWAAYSGSLDVIRLLLERGADTQVTYKKARVQRPAYLEMSFVASAWKRG